MQFEGIDLMMTSKEKTKLSCPIRLSSTPKTIAFWLLGFIAPIVFLMLVCALTGTYPFGGESFLTEDAKYQYIDFFTWYKHVLQGDGSLMYSSAQSLGMNTWSLFCFYLASPLNLLIVFFDENHLVLFMFVVCALKLGLIQVCFMWYLGRRFEGLGAWAMPLAFGITFCSWIITDIRNPMWLDMLYWLPLALLGAYALVTKRRWRLLLGAFVGAVITCWYTAYMLILFTILYALLESYVEHVHNDTYALKDFFGMLARGAGVVVLALALSAFTFVPTVISFVSGSGLGVSPIPDAPVLSVDTSEGQDGKPIAQLDQAETPAAVDVAADPNAKSRGLLAAVAEKAKSLVLGLFTGACDFNKNPLIPQLFGGTFLIAAALFFLLSRLVARRVKIAFFVFAAFMILSVEFYPLYTFWCGMRAPSGFFCRIAMFFPVLLLWASAYGIQEARNKPYQATAATVSTVLACIAPCVLWALGLVAGVLTAVLGVASALCTLLVFMTVSASEKPALKTVLSCTVVGLVLFCELLANACVAWDSLYIGYTQSHHDAYTQKSQQLRETIHTQDAGTYREAKTFNRASRVSLNEGMASGYQEISSYSSAHNEAAVWFLNTIGYSRQSEISVRYRAPLLLTDSLLGVKYVLSDKAAPGYVEQSAQEFPGLSIDEGVWPGARLYKNPYALPLAYAVDGNAGSLTFDTPANPFERQNALASALLGSSVELYTPCEAKLVSTKGCQTWSVQVPAGSVGYYYVMDRNISLLTTEPKAYVQVNDGPVYDDAWRFDNGIFPLGDVAGNEQSYTVRLSSNIDMNAPATEGTWCIFYKLDLKAFEDVMAKLKQGSANITSFKDGAIEIDVDASSPDGELLMVSMPYDKGWTVQVNGKAVQAEQIMRGALTGIKVPAGKSHISMSYMTPGLVPGCAVTIVAVLVLLGILFIARLRRKKA